MRCSGETVPVKSFRHLSDNRLSVMLERSEASQGGEAYRFQSHTAGWGYLNSIPLAFSPFAGNSIFAGTALSLSGMVQ